jgi:uncharacterized membrane protein HdeD (DUF308 family)
MKVENKRALLELGIILVIFLGYFIVTHGVAASAVAAAVVTVWFVGIFTIIVGASAISRAVFKDKE